MLGQNMKQQIRDAWAAAPGFYSHGAALMPVENVATSRKKNRGVCASFAMPQSLRLAIPLRLNTAFVDMNDAFASKDGVTPRERRDCMILLLDLGVFDDLDV